MSTTQDDTLTGSSELEIRSGDQPKIDLRPSERPRQRDLIEEEAAKKAAQQAAERFRRMAGIAEVPAEPAEPPQDAPQEGQGQPRDELGRFASPNPSEAPQQPQEGQQPAEQPVQQAPPVPSAADLSPDTLVKVKINGQEQLVPWSEVQRNFQIEQAARQKLERASLLERELLSRVQNPQQQPVQTPTESVPPDQNALITELADKIAFGNKDEIATTLQKFIGAQPSQQPVATPEIMQMVEQRLALMQHEAAARADLSVFSTEHQDIVKDPDLQQLVTRRVERGMRDDLLALGSDPTWVEQLHPTMLGFQHRRAQGLAPNIVRPTLTLLRDAATQVKGRFTTPSGPTQSPAIQQRLDAKRSAPQPVSAAVQQRAPTPQSDRPKTASEQIEEERAARARTRGVSAPPNFRR